MPTSRRSELLPLLIFSVVTSTGCGAAEGDDGDEDPGPVPAAIVVSPALDTVVVKANASFAVQVTDSAGEPIAGLTPTWSVLEPARATVSANGLVTTLTVGTARIVAHFGEFADTATLLIHPSLVVEPVTWRGVMVGDTLPLTVTGKDALGAGVSVPGTPVWSVLSGGVTVNASGRVIGTLAGPATLRVEWGGSRSDLPLTVFPGVANGHRELGFVMPLARAVGGTAPGPAMMDLASGAVTALRDSNDYTEWFRWSPSGDRVVYYALTANGVGRSGAVVHTVAGADFTVISSSGNAPDWMPNGSRLVFAEHEPTGGDVDIWSSDASGGARQLLISTWLVEHRPAPSPDGQWIAFRMGIDPTTELWIMRANGTGHRRIDLPFAVSEFEWSPDGRFIAFQGIASPEFHGVWVIRSDGTGLTSLTPDCSNNGSCSATYMSTTPTWHPDGRQLLYWRAGPSGRELRVVRRDGTFIRSFPNYCGQGRFSPDGQLIAATDSVGEFSHCALVTTAPDGSGRVIRDSAQAHLNSISRLSWRP